MSFANGIAKFLDLPTKGEVEILQKQLATQEQLLKDVDVSILPKTFISAQGRESKKVEDVPGLVGKRVSVKQLQHLYLTNQFIFRGVNVRADELVTRGYEIIGDDKKGVDACKKLITDSGGINLFWQLSVNTDVAGDGYLEMVPNQTKTQLSLLKHVNPLNFGFKTDKETGKIILNDNKEPVSYMQIVYDEGGEEERKDVEKGRIAHLKFNTFADEFSGISSIQPVYNTSIRLMNMEHAASEASVKTANPLFVGTTETKSPNELSKWSKVLSNISGKEQVFLPNGVKLDILSPGTQNFNDYAEYFLNAVVAALGVPKAILLGDSGAGSGNRATTQKLSKHFYSVIRSNQRYIEIIFNDIFEKYAALAGFSSPRLLFNDIAEDADIKGQRAIELYDGGLITLKEARSIIGLETTPIVEKELINLRRAKAKIDPDKPEKKADMETWHPEEPGSVSGSQKGEKKKKKPDTDIPSVK